MAARESNLMSMFIDRPGTHSMLSVCWVFQCSTTQPRLTSGTRASAKKALRPHQRTNIGAHKAATVCAIRMASKEGTPSSL